MNYNKALRLANETAELRDTDVDIDIPMDKFSLIVYLGLSQKYGQLIPKKIIRDSMGVLTPTNPNVGPGDAFINTLKGIIHYEIKCTYTSKNGMYSLTQLRMFEDYQYFIIALFDRTDNFKSRFYVIPKEVLRKLKLQSMHGNKKVNSENKFIEERVSLTTMDAYDFFGYHNILPGTSYDDLRSYYFQLGVSQHVNPNVKMNVPLTGGQLQNHRCSKSFYEKRTTIYFTVNNERIMGDNNKDTVRLLIEHLGTEEAMKFFTNSILSKERGEYHNMMIGDCYYNPRLSIRDIRNFMARGAKNSKVIVKMTELR